MGDWKHLFHLASRATQCLRFFLYLIGSAISISFAPSSLSPGSPKVAVSQDLVLRSIRWENRSGRRHHVICPRLYTALWLSRVSDSVLHSSFALRQNFLLQETSQPCPVPVTIARELGCVQTYICRRGLCRPFAITQTSEGEWRHGWTTALRSWREPHSVSEGGRPQHVCLTQLGWGSDSWLN